MSIPQTPTPARLVVSILFKPDEKGSSGDFLGGIIAALTDKFGPADMVSDASPFTQTTYYNKEMGADLFRVFASFERLVPREQLAEIKLTTNRLEKQFSRNDGSRRCNIDPGLLTVENFILATGKNFTHRIYLKEGIFSEVTLLFQNGIFQTLPWTYWDYAADDIIDMLTNMRKKLIQELKVRKLL